MAKRKKIKGNVLAEGEVTGHAHRANVSVFDAGNGIREFDSAATITHEEHKQIEVPKPKGKWQTGIVQEFDYATQERVNVAD